MDSTSVDVQKNQPSLSPEARRQAMQRCIREVAHACQCRDAACDLQGCRKMKRVLQHYKGCKKKVNGSCRACEQLIFLCCYHAKRCRQQKCPMPFCLIIKRKLGQLELQQLLGRQDVTSFLQLIFSPSPQETRHQYIQWCANTMGHANQCRDVACSLQGCHKMKRVVQRIKKRAQEYREARQVAILYDCPTKPLPPLGSSRS
ncbi:histone lysine acetyltransferase CREBBP-like [Branchiostoma floridae]|uniref:histone acetyltransferase n=1 Tax=Branchiostoma floridae TaxID=7739 RepID=A0A9J7MGG6_BRAFL|nr:histone lysine acetyltransferase CREBBP-like [Branchiostoma floridae]